MIQTLLTPDNRRIAFAQTPGSGPGVVFLGGFKSDMTGTKAVWLENWAKARGQAFLRFDYSGHGASGGDFLDGCIGDWFDDTMAVIGARTQGPQILAGSSMGGWIALLVARAVPHRVAGLVAIAAAPDFTEDSLWAGFTPHQRAELMEAGRVALPSEYGDGPYIITRRLIVKGRESLVLRSPLSLPFPTRLLQGTKDADVPLSVALRLIEHAQAPDLRLTLVKDADHRFSTPGCLALIGQTLEDLLPGAANASIW